MNTTKEAFSKSVIWASMLRNSTRQPIGDFGGGGLNLSVCQLVDWMFCSWRIINACPETNLKTDLEMVCALTVVLINELGEYNNRITNK